jgi:hypothetical protein
MPALYAMALITVLALIVTGAEYRTPFTSLGVLPSSEYRMLAPDVVDVIEIDKGTAQGPPSGENLGAAT